MKCCLPEKIPRSKGPPGSLVVDSKISPMKMRQKAMKCSEEFVYYFRAKPNQLHQRRACAPLEAGMKFSVGHGAEKEAGRGIMIAI